MQSKDTLKIIVKKTEVFEITISSETKETPTTDRIVVEVDRKG